MAKTLTCCAVEMCSNCMVEIDMSKVVEDCPQCRKPVVACSMCDRSLSCKDCKSGSNFVERKFEKYDVEE